MLPVHSCVHNPCAVSAVFCVCTRARDGLCGSVWVCKPGANPCSCKLPQLVVADVSLLLGITLTVLGTCLVVCDRAFQLAAPLAGVFHRIVPAAFEVSCLGNV